MLKVLLNSLSSTSMNSLGNWMKLTEVDNLQGVPPTGGEGETMVTP